jgi:hypothetical protein
MIESLFGLIKGVDKESFIARVSQILSAQVS